MYKYKSAKGDRGSKPCIAVANADSTLVVYSKQNKKDSKTEVTSFHIKWVFYQTDTYQKC